MAPLAHNELKEILAACECMHKNTIDQKLATELKFICIEYRIFFSTFKGSNIAIWVSIFHVNAA